MSIMLNDYVNVKDLKPVVPSWYRQERYDYCERNEVSGNSSKRSIFSRRAGKKHSK